MTREKNYKIFFNDIIEAVGLIQKFVEKMSFEEFKRNQIVRDATVYRLQIIGEAAYHIPDSIKEQYSQIPWKEIMKGVRNRLIHVYDEVNMEVIWDIIKNDLGPLEKQIRLILNSISDSPSSLGERRN